MSLCKRPAHRSSDKSWGIFSNRQLTDFICLQAALALMSHVADCHYSALCCAATPSGAAQGGCNHTKARMPGEFFFSFFPIQMNLTSMRLWKLGTQEGINSIPPAKQLSLCYKVEFVTGKEKKITTVCLNNLPSRIFFPVAFAAASKCINHFVLWNNYLLSMREALRFNLHCVCNVSSQTQLCHQSLSMK